jgi:hypothetical protein
MDLSTGQKKVDAVEKIFMVYKPVKECVASLKSKNSEGFDRNPKRCLGDGINVLFDPLAKLFGLLYNTQMIPDQWRV